MKSIVLRRQFTKDRREKPLYDYTAKEINDEIIRKAVRDCLGDYLFATISGAKFTFRYPYCVLFYYRHELLRYVEG